MLKRYTNRGQRHNEAVIDGIFRKCLAKFKTGDSSLENDPRARINLPPFKTMM